MNVLFCRTGGRGRTLLALLAVLMGMAASALGALASAAGLSSEERVDTPARVLLTPQSARIHAERSVTVTRQNGQSVLILLLPQGSDDLTVSLKPPHGERLRFWDSETLPLPSGGGAVAQRREALREDQDRLQGEILATKACMALWSTPSTGVLSVEQMEQREARLRATLPAAHRELARLERDLEDLRKKLEETPDTARFAQRVTVFLDGNVKEGTIVGVSYTYTLLGCGWRPFYIINAASEGIQVRLQADIWQYSGVDWTDAHISLVTQEIWQRTPNPLRPWVIQKREMAPMPRAQRREARMGAPAADMLMATSAPQPFESDTLSGWELPKGMVVPEGKTRLPILREVWQDSLQRVARPSGSDGRVWIMAVHTFGGQRRLPAGQATFSLEGVAMGPGHFAPQGDAVTLFFGSDPLMEVKTEPDTRLTGKSGIINKRQTWKWGWTYTVINHRAQAVSVRLEEPAPQIGDEGVSVTLEDSPPAQRGEDHTLYWDVQTPANGKVQVRHGVSISAPEGLDIFPGR